MSHAIPMIITEDCREAVEAVRAALPRPTMGWPDCRCRERGQLVDVESPYHSVDREREGLLIFYARAAMADCLRRGEFPFASHLLYTQPGILNDRLPEQRVLGIKAGDAWASFANRTVVYLDYGISSGMQEGLLDAALRGRPVFYRQLCREEFVALQHGVGCEHCTNGIGAGGCGGC